MEIYDPLPPIDLLKYGLLVPLEALAGKQQVQQVEPQSKQQGTCETLAGKQQVQQVEPQSKKGGTWLGTTVKVSVGLGITAVIGYVAYKKIYVKGFNAGVGHGFDSGVSASAKAFVRGARKHFSSSGGQTGAHSTSANTLGPISGGSVQVTPEGDDKIVATPSAQGIPEGGDKIVAAPSAQGISERGDANVAHPSVQASSEEFEKNVENWFKDATMEDRPSMSSTIAEDASDSILTKFYSDGKHVFSRIEHGVSQAYSDGKSFVTSYQVQGTVFTLLFTHVYSTVFERVLFGR